MISVKYILWTVFIILEIIMCIWDGKINKMQDNVMYVFKYFQYAVWVLVEIILVLSFILSLILCHYL